MTRTVHLILACALLFVLLLSALPASASSPSPCTDTAEPVSAANCARFRTYLQKLVDRRSDHPSVAIPESTMRAASRGYAHNLDDNDVAYIPESTMTSPSRGYAHNWDDNDVAYIPESTMTVPLEELFGAEFVQVDGE